MNRISFFASALVALMLLSLQSASAISVSSTACNYLHSSVAFLSDSVMSLSWRLESDLNGDRQTAYQVVVCDRLSSRVVYDSRKVDSSASQHVQLPICVPSGPGLSWRVRVWDVNGTPSDWSREQVVRFVSPDCIECGSLWIGAVRKDSAHIPSGRWSNGMFKKPQFKEAWGGVDTLSASSIELHRDFKARRRNIVDAVLYVAGLGHYEVDINGVSVSDDMFAPLWSEYSKSVYFNAFDVTTLLHKGVPNHIKLLLGNGFFNVQARGRYAKLQTSFGAPQARVRLVMTYDDGSEQVVVSDCDWSWRTSPITFNSIYGGESYDARLEGVGQLRNVVAVEGPDGQLRLQSAPPVRIMERFPVVKWLSVGPDSLAVASKVSKRSVDPSVRVADMGQNLSGFPEIRVRGRKGQKVTLVVSEALTPQGVCNQRETGRQHFYEYTLKGAPDGESWHPHFSYYGFRFIQVEGCRSSDSDSDLPELLDLHSCFVYSSAAEGSSFECSSDILTRAHRLIERAERSNMQAVLTDCPHREKLGWLEQDHLCGPSLLMNYDLSTYVPKIIQDIVDSQKSDGMVPTTAPQYVSFGDLFDDSPEWGATLVVLPFMYRDRYQDPLLIVRHYDAMSRFVDYLSSRRTSDGVLDYGLGDWYDFVDGEKAGFAKNTPVALVASAHYIFCLQLMSQAAVITHRFADEERFLALRNEAVDAFNAKFYDSARHSYATGSQTSNALPLFLGIAPDPDGVLASLVSDIHAHGDRLSTGDVGNRYLFQVLAASGNNDLLFKMLNHYDTPGYGYQIRQGATTLTEQWDPVQGSSQNHFMMGQIDEWLFATLAGFENVGGPLLSIRPHLPAGVDFVRASTTTLYGRVAVDVTSERLVVSVPVGCEADVALPVGGRTVRVGSGVTSIPFARP